MRCQARPCFHSGKSVVSLGHADVFVSVLPEICSLLGKQFVEVQRSRQTEFLALTQILSEPQFPIL